MTRQCHLDPPLFGISQVAQSLPFKGLRLSSFKAADLNTAQVCATIPNSVFLQFVHISEPWQLALKPEALSN